jgi:hypothetical protein
MSTDSEKKDSKKSKGEKSQTDQWREAERAAISAEAIAEVARNKADLLASELSKELIEKHKSACVELDGVKYSPKAGATRTLKDGTTKAPKYPFQLVRTKDKGVVEV